MDTLIMTRREHALHIGYFNACEVTLVIVITLIVVFTYLLTYLLHTIAYIIIGYL